MSDALGIFLVVFCIGITFAMVVIFELSSRKEEERKHEYEMEKLRLETEKNSKANNNFIYSEEGEEESLPQLPEEMSSFYKEMSIQISLKKKEVQFKFSSLNEVMDSLFPENSITNSRFSEKFSTAQKQAESVLEKAEKVLKAFGATAEPSEERKEILGGYLTAANKIINKVDSMIDELLKMDLKQVDDVSSTVETQLAELQETTHLYI